MLTALRGPRAGSAAAEAGLQEGAAVRGWSVYRDRPVLHTELTVVGADGPELEIRYLPAGPEVSCQRLVPGGDCSGL